MSDDDQRVHLRGFGLSNFRSFRARQLFGSLSQTSVIIGMNNSGKSNALNLLSRVASRSFKSSGELDVPLELDEQTPHELLLAFTPGDLVQQLARRGQANDKELSQLVETLFSDPAYRLGSDSLAWISVAITINHSDPGASVDFRALPHQSENLNQGAAAAAAQRLSERLINGYSSDPSQNAYQVVHMLDLFTMLPPVLLIDAARQIRPTDDFDDLIGTIDSWKNPGSTRAERALERKYHGLNKLVADVLGAPAAEIRIPNDRSTIQVSLPGGRFLPLEHLGTGVHQLIRLAVSATEADESLVCIEEPEVHMHPTMQKRLLHYLQTSTSNQYIISTHSSAFLNHPDLTIFTVRDTASGTSVSRAAKPDEVVSMSQELGYRASDLLQANFVIWVEGPSDRIYLTFWIRKHRPDLIEGADYSVMFFGGQLASHLTAAAEEDLVHRAGELVQLCKLARNFLLLIDSDRKAEGEPLGQWKVRLEKELADAPGRTFWLTEGYTIENYVPVEILREAFEVLHPRTTFLWNGELYENPLGGLRARKVDVAREVIKRWSTEVPLPALLETRIEKLTNSIQAANTLD